MNQMLHSMHTDAEERHSELEHTLQCHLTALKGQEERIQELEGKVKRDRVKFIAWTNRMQELEDKLLKEKAQVHKINGQINVLSEQVCHCNAPAPITPPPRVPSPALSYISQQSYHTPPHTSPSTPASQEPIPIRVAEAVLDLDQENRPPIGVETGDEGSEAEDGLALVEAIFQRTGTMSARRALVRAQARAPHCSDPYPNRMALGTRSSRYARESIVVANLFVDSTTVGSHFDIKMVGVPGRGFLT
jgi:hypothetical protein